MAGGPPAPPDKYDQELNSRLTDMQTVAQGWQAAIAAPGFDYTVLLPKIVAFASNLQSYVDTYRQDKNFATINSK